MWVWEGGGDSGGKGIEGTEEEGTPRVGSHSHVRNHGKYPDYRIDLIGGAVTETFAPGSKYPCAATAAGLAYSATLAAASE